MAIPIRNLYFVLCYAWNHFKSLDRIPASAEEADAPVDLLARMLVNGLATRLKRGLDRGYRTLVEETASPTGKILMTASIPSVVRRSGRLVCESDELTVDVYHNRLLKRTVQHMLGRQELALPLRRELRRLLRGMHGIASAEWSSFDRACVQLHRNNVDYRFLLHVCDLYWQGGVGAREAGSGRLPRLDFSPQQMGLVFQAFVLNFLRREQADYTVRGAQIPWSGAGGDEASQSVLPKMVADVLVEHPEFDCIVEIKFDPTPLASGRGGAPRLKNDHLNQLLTYLSNHRSRVSKPVFGLLLYAWPGRDFAFDYEILGIPLFVRALNLDAPSSEIARQLLDLVPACVRKLGGCRAGSRLAYVAQSSLAKSGISGGGKHDMQ